MVSPTKLKTSRPVVTTAPAKASAPALPVATPKARPASSEFRAVKKKGGNFTGGGFKAVVRTKPGNAHLAGETKAKLAAAAVNGAPVKADVKVTDALQRLTVKTPASVKDLLAENAKLDPTQQHALKLALPDKLRLQLDAELEKLPPALRGPQLTWMGDKQLPGVGKDGYVAVTIAPDLTFKENGGIVRMKYAAKIDLGGGKSVTAAPAGDWLLVKSGGQSLRADKVVGGWAFKEQVKTGKPGELPGPDGKFWRTVSPGSKEQQTMMAAFREGAIMAENIGGLLDPGTEQLFRDRAIDAAVPGARKALEKLSTDAAQWTGFVKSSAEWVGANQKWLAPALKAGHLEMLQSPDGSMSLDLKRAPGMKDSEWKKLQAEFGPRVAQFAERLSKDQQWLATELSIRDRAASGALATFKGPSFQKYLSTLSPRQRLDEVTRLAQSLKGSHAGSQLADSLMGPAAFKVGAGGKLEPASELAKTVFGGARTPEAREALQQLGLALGPQLSSSGADTLARTVEVLRGEPLSARQRAGIDALHSITSPQQFEELINPDPKSPESVLNKAGDVSDILAELGGASAADKLGKSTNPKVKAVSKGLEPHALALSRGAHYLAVFQVFNSTKDLIQEGVTVDTAASFAEDASRAIGTWGQIMDAAGKSGVISKVGKFAGPVSDAIGLINDMRRDSSSRGGNIRNGVHVGASAMILAGGLGGGPVGVAAVLIGLGVKLAVSRTSEAYEDAHGTLKRLPDIQ